MAINDLGVKVAVEGVQQDGHFAGKIWHSTLYDDEYLFNSGKSDWMIRWLLVKKMFTKDRWKYRDIAQQNVWKQFFRNAIGFFFDKD